MFEWGVALCFILEILSIGKEFLIEGTVCRCKSWHVFQIRVFVSVVQVPVKCDSILYLSAVLAVTAVSSHWQCVKVPFVIGTVFSSCIALPLQNVRSYWHDVWVKDWCVICINVNMGKALCFALKSYGTPCYECHQHIKSICALHSFLSRHDT